MKNYTILYDHDGICGRNVTAEWLQNALNDPKNYFHGHKILEDFPHSTNRDEWEVYESWPDNSILIFKDGAIYIPQKVSHEVTKTVEEYVLED